MSLISTVTTTVSVSPMRLPAVAELLGQTARQQPGQRLALLLAVDDGLVQQPEPVAAPPGSPDATPAASLTKTASTSASTASGGSRRAAAMALIGLPSAIMPSSSSSAADEPARAR